MFLAEVRSNYEQLQNDAKEKETKAFERIKALETSRDDEKKQAAALNEKVVQLKGNLEMCFRNMTTCTNDADTQMQAVKTRDEENHSLKDQINNLQKYAYFSFTSATKDIQLCKKKKF